MALRRVLFEYFGFLCQFSFHQILHHHNHSGQARIGQSVAAVPSGPSWTSAPTKGIKKSGMFFFFVGNLTIHSVLSQYSIG
jgi:hypothetical protein